MSSNQINGGKQYIDFGNYKVEIGKSDGVKKKTLSYHCALNDDTFNSIFNKFDTNKDGKFDNIELQNIYQQYLDAAKDGKMSKKEAKAFAKQLGLENVDQMDFASFLNTIARDDDDFSAQWEDNIYREKDGNKTIVREYSDPEHTQIAKETVKEGNTTKVTENNKDGKVITTTLGIGSTILSKTVEEFDIKDHKTREVVTDAKGKETVKEFDEDGNYTIKDDYITTKYDKDGHKLDEQIDYYNLPRMNEGMIMYMVFSKKGNVDPEYLAILAKFPKVSVAEVADLIRTYPSTAPMITTYFNSENAEQTENNFADFLNNLGINYRAEGYSISHSSITHGDGSVEYTPVLYFEGKPLAKEMMLDKMKEFFKV